MRGNEGEHGNLPQEEGGTRRWANVGVTTILKRRQQDKINWESTV